MLVFTLKYENIYMKGIKCNSSNHNTINNLINFAQKIKDYEKRARVSMNDKEYKDKVKSSSFAGFCDNLL
jgi:hypothetical protein